ncbi:tpr domain protein [Moniliophthora roreri MCA 2997]|uniref:Tpr domain protein n=1 Tax=Moniliophthora roreri (strain MCA 2997) TaxID=1381753 RepID=V2X3G4_MONRO|nr:tpr domain protein [Moniliophthora roreri MCA 2997]
MNLPSTECLFSRSQIAIDLNMPLHIVQRVKQTWRELGMVCRDRHGKGWSGLLSPEQTKFFIALLEHSLDMYLDEAQEQLLYQHGIWISLAALSRTLRRLGYSSKKLSRAASEWGMKGLKVHKQCDFVQGTCYSLLPVLMIDGLIYSHVKIGGYNGEEFTQWLEGLFGVINPYPGPHSVLVLDNCCIYHVPGVEEMCEKQGIKLIYLPLYCPYLNSVEESFSFVKSYIHCHGHKFRDIMETGDPIDPFLFLYNTLDQITPIMARGWFRHSEYI